MNYSKEKQVKNKFTRTKNSIAGITLIALVITVIVLLILAGVSIAMLTGDNRHIIAGTKSKDKNR